MQKELDQKTTTHFLLRLTKDEKKKLHIVAARNNTTITSLVRYLLSNNKTLEEL